MICASGAVDPALHQRAGGAGRRGRRDEFVAVDPLTAQRREQLAAGELA